MRSPAQSTAGGTGSGDILRIEDYSLILHGPQSDRALLRNIDLGIAKGEVLGLVGESGSGKSLTSLAVMGLLPQVPGFEAHGSIYFHSEELTAASPARMRELRGARIALISQDPMASFNPAMRIGDQIVEPLIVHQGWTHADAKRHAIELLDRVGVRQANDLVDAYPHQFSGGMLQRAAIAMAVSAGPSLLLADEPTTALDVSVQERILRLLKKLCAEDELSMMFISHDMNVVATVADRIAVMRSGEILESGPTVDLIKAPRNEYTRELLDAVPDISAPALSRRLPTAGTHRGGVSGRSGAPLIRVEGLDVRFSTGARGLFRSRQRQILKDISFDLRRGEILGLVGESGSGKSTTARAIVRLVTPSGGTITFDGVNLLGLAPRRMRRVSRQIQMVYQDPYSSLNPFHTVRQTLEAALRNHSRLSRPRRQERVVESIAAVGLGPEFLDRYPHELSGGQRQRLGIARALILRPEVVILDEALSALDVSIQAQVLKLLVELQHELELTYLFISHDLATVKSVCDRVIFMNDGEIVEIGATQEVFAQPSDPYTKLLLSAVPNAASELRDRDS